MQRSLRPERRDVCRKTSIEAAIPALLQEAARWELYPIWSVDDQCVCTCPKRERCEHPGKHPATPNGFIDASSDPVRIAEMMSCRPGANFGLRTGKGSGVAVLDIDSWHGGGQSLKRLQAEHGKLPATRIHQSGGADLHYIYAFPQELERVPSRTLAPGVELKADGAGVVLPPSNHWGGGTYGVLIEVPLAPLPCWVVEQVLRPELTLLKDVCGDPTPWTRSRFALPKRIREGTRNTTLHRYASSLRACGCEYPSILEELQRVNREICDQPPIASHPFEDDEVRKVAASAAAYPAGDASKVAPEVLAIVTLLQGSANTRTKKGMGGHSRWALYRALLDCCGEHGWMHRGRDVAARVSVRQLALDSGLALRTVHRTLDALIASGLVYRLSVGEGTTPGVLALRIPTRVAQGDTIRTTPPPPPTGVGSCHSGATTPLYRLRHGAGRLGKAAGAVLEMVVKCGESGASPRELAAMLGTGTKPESLRAPLKKLVDRGLLERRVRGRYWAAASWPHMLDRERTLTGEKKAENLDRAQYEREREAYRQHLAEKGPTGWGRI